MTPATPDVYLVDLEDRTRPGGWLDPDEQARMAFLWFLGRGIASAEEAAVHVLCGRELEARLWGKEARLVFVQNAPACEPHYVYFRRFRSFLHEHSRVLTRDSRVRFPVSLVLFAATAEEGERRLSVWRRTWPDDCVVQPLVVDLSEGMTCSIGRIAAKVRGDWGVPGNLLVPGVYHHRVATDAYLGLGEDLRPCKAPGAGGFGWKVLSIDDEWSRSGSGSPDRRCLDACMGIVASHLGLEWCGERQPDLCRYVEDGEQDSAPRPEEETCGRSPCPTRRGICLRDFPSLPPVVEGRSGPRQMAGTEGDPAGETGGEPVRPDEALRRLIEERCPDIDIVLLDAIQRRDEPAGEERGEAFADRLRDTIHQIEHFRDLGDFPLVFVLSQLRTAEMAAVAVRAGADWFFNKREFLLQAPTSLAQVIPKILELRHRGAVTVDSPSEGQIPKPVAAELIRRVLHAPPGSVGPFFERRYGEGKSGARTELWRGQVRSREAGRSSDAHPATAVYRVIKLDNRDAVLSERENYLRYVVGKIDNFSGRIDAFVPVSYRAEERSLLSLRRDAALSYTFSGSRADLQHDSLYTLEKFLGFGPDSSKLSRAIDRLVQEGLRPLHGAKHGWPNPWHSPDRWLRPRLAALRFRAAIGDEAVRVTAAEGKLRTVCAEIDMAKPDHEADNLVIRAHVVPVSNPPETEADGGLCGLRLRLAVPFSENRDLLTGSLRYLLRRRKRFRLDLGGVPEYVRDKTNRFLATETAREAVPEGFAVAGSIWASPWLYFRPDCWEDGGCGQKRVDAVHDWMKEDLRSNWEALAVSFAGAIARLGAQAGAGFGLVHGDLQCRNIMISADDDVCRLIDFADTGPGYPAYDYAKLEVDIRAAVVAPLLPLASAKHSKVQEIAEIIETFERGLWEGKGPGTDGFPASDRGAARASLDAVSLLRECAYPSDSLLSEDYRAMLLLYAARACAYGTHVKSQMPSTVYGRLWCYLAAKVAALGLGRP